MAIREKRPIIRSTALNQYILFLRNHQCVSQATIDLRSLYVSQFLANLKDNAAPSKLKSLSAKTVHDFIIITARMAGRAKRKHISSSLRSFLRFAFVNGYITRNLVDAVPVIAIRKLDYVPKTIPWEAVKRLLKMPDRSQESGRRDYAILLLLATYGVRMGQAKHLRLRDIKWDEGVIHFQPSKGGKPLSFPLQLKVAKALLDYIRKDRGSANFPDVFLTVKGPRRPIKPANHFWSVLRKYYQKAGIDVKFGGSHPIRHAFATRLVEKKTPIKTIADLLGHRWIDTTFIYTKVDIVQLRTVACEWPEGGVQ